MSLGRYKTNPFVEGMVITTSQKQVRVSAMGKDSNVLVNQDTGEMRGTQLVTYKQVDDEEFIKLFSGNIALAFNLNSAGIKAFSILIWLVQYRAIGKDMIVLDHISLEDWQDEHTDKKISLATFKRGINQLEKSKILAKTMRKGSYFINPNFIFNGNRVVFSTIYEKKTKEGNLK